MEEQYLDITTVHGAKTDYDDTATRRSISDNDTIFESRRFEFANMVIGSRARPLICLFGIFGNLLNIIIIIPIGKLNLLL